MPGKPLLKSRTHLGFRFATTIFCNASIAKNAIPTVIETTY